MKYTSKLWDIELVWYFEHDTKKEAIVLEKKIKRSWHIEIYTNYDLFIKHVGH